MQRGVAQGGKDATLRHTCSVTQALAQVMVCSHRTGGGRGTKTYARGTVGSFHTDTAVHEFWTSGNVPNKHAQMTHTQNTQHTHKHTQNRPHHVGDSTPRTLTRESRNKWRHDPRVKHECVRIACGRHSRKPWRWCVHRTPTLFPQRTAAHQTSCACAPLP